MKQHIKQNFWSFFKTIKFSIVFCNLAILLASVTFIIFYTQKGTNEILIQTTQSFMKISNGNLQQQIGKIFARIEKATYSGSLIFSSYKPSNEFSSTASKILTSFTEQNLYATSVYFGKSDGFFISCGHKSETDTFAASKDKKLPQTVQFYWKTIHTENNTRKEIWNYLDQNNNLLEREIINDSKYDPRKRPWYEQAKNERTVTWADVYYFTGSFKENGITASAPMMDPIKKEQVGVFAIDVGLSKINKLLLDFKATENSNIYIITNSGKIICSTETLTKKYDDQNNVLIPSIEESDYIHIKHLLNSGTDDNSEKTLANVHAGDKEYIAQVSDFKLGSIQWKILNTTPVDDLLTPVKKKRHEIFLWSVIILATSSLIMLLFARKISILISSLSRTASNIENFRLDHSEKIKSSILEIQALSNSMAAMQSSMKSFSKYVPKDLVIKLMKDDALSEITGDMKEISLMFTDIANFTTISEACKPHDLIKQISEYFESLTQIIIDNKGNVDKYIGDAIMSFWGAPDFNPTHPTDACHAALQIQRLLRTKNSDWINLGLPPFATRIGIHTATVIVGNIGSDLRMNYTAIGDDVNLAARLEGLNKYYHTNILISGDTYAKVSGDFLARPLGKVAVKGKDTYTTIYELIGALRHVDPKLLLSPHNIKEYEKYRVAYDYFEQQRFQSALEIFTDIEVKDGPVLMMLEECQKLCTTPPGDDWKGLIKNASEK